MIIAHSCKIFNFSHYCVTDDRFGRFIRAKKSTPNMYLTMKIFVKLLMDLTLMVRGAQYTRTYFLYEKSGLEVRNFLTFPNSF